jgi:peroxiredoxin (alkyl hydroperoxide reductase subunit C)
MKMSLVTKEAPKFKAVAVVDKQFQQVALDDYDGKWVVLFFYPLDFTFVCPTEITAFADSKEEFDELNTQLLCCSVDSQYSHLAWINTPRKYGGVGEMNYPMISDLNKNIGSDYGVLLDGPGVTLRGLFIIDPEGKVAFEVVHDLGIGRNVGEVLRVLKAIQANYETGDVCPANWMPGDDTMKSDPEGSKEYFDKHA